MEHQKIFEHQRRDSKMQHHVSWFQAAIQYPLWRNNFNHDRGREFDTCPGFGQYGAQGGGGTLAGLVEAGVGDFALVPFCVTPFIGLPAIPVAIC